MFLGIEDRTVNDQALWKRRIEEGGVLNLRIARRKDQIVPVWSYRGSAETWFRLLIEMIFLTLEKSFLVLSF